MIGWALRTVLVWGALCLVGFYGWQHRAEFAGFPFAPSGRHAGPPGSAANILTFKPDFRGHFIIDGWVNGSPVKFLVDTGASFVTLTPADAESAGIRPRDLHYTETLSTASGTTRVAPVQLRELRLGQLSMEDVSAVVIDTPLSVSLLGMSFLRRLDHYEMRDGELVVSW